LFATIMRVLLRHFTPTPLISTVCYADRAYVGISA
jgi:hypothetical protein